MITTISYTAIHRAGRVATAVLVAAAAALATTAAARADDDTKTTFRRVPTQFIAALGDPQSRSGTGAEAWGIWRVDPGPRGVWLKRFDDLEAAGGMAPAKWQFDKSDWWVDENGLLMEKPSFPLPAGKYVVTGDREAVTVLTIHPADASGKKRWELDDDITLYDVTHLPCRSARYTQAAGAPACTPASAVLSDFPVTPGGIMPAVEGCAKQDYSVLFIIGVAVTD